MKVLGTVLGLGLLVNGLLMLRDPLWWYGAVPTVPLTGPFNQHFVRDIGLIYVITAIGFVHGAFRPATRVPAWIAATSFHVLHGSLHTWETLVGICTTASFAKDFLPVMTPALLGVVLVACNVRFPAGRLRSA